MSATKLGGKTVEEVLSEFFGENPPPEVPKVEVKIHLGTGIYVALVRAADSMGLSVDEVISRAVALIAYSVGRYKPWRTESEILLAEPNEVPT